MDCPPSQAERINSFALVCYLPGALGTFIDSLRRELVTNCVARSHVTILPPRPLGAVLRGDLSLNDSRSEARAQVAGCVPDFAPFQVELANVEIFPKTQVIYLELTRGSGHLRILHDSLNSKALLFDEPHQYHPHVTLAQDVAPGDVVAAHELACARWQEFHHSRAFQAETLTFVQNTQENRWIDLMGYELGSMAGVAR